MAKKIVDVPVCYVCGGKGVVPRMYLDVFCGLKEGSKLIKCPRCYPEKGKPLNPVGSKGHTQS